MPPVLGWWMLRLPWLRLRNNLRLLRQILYKHHFEVQHALHLIYYPDETNSFGDKCVGLQTLIKYCYELKTVHKPAILILILRGCSPRMVLWVQSAGG